MVEGARLESVYRGNSIEGSNPSLSAIMSNVGHDRQIVMFAKDMPNPLPSPLLKPLHPDTSLSAVKLAQMQRLSIEMLILSLAPGQKDCLKTRPDEQFSTDIIEFSFSASAAWTCMRCRERSM